MLLLLLLNGLHGLSHDYIDDNGVKQSASFKTSVRAIRQSMKGVEYGAVPTQMANYFQAYEAMGGSQESLANGTDQKAQAEFYDKYHFNFGEVLGSDYNNIGGNFEQYKVWFEPTEVNETLSSKAASGRLKNQSDTADTGAAKLKADSTRIKNISKTTDKRG